MATPLCVPLGKGLAATKTAIIFGTTHGFGPLPMEATIHRDSFEYPRSSSTLLTFARTSSLPLSAAPRQPASKHSCGPPLAVLCVSTDIARFPLHDPRPFRYSSVALLNSLAVSPPPCGRSVHRSCESCTSPRFRSTRHPSPRVQTMRLDQMMWNCIAAYHSTALSGISNLSAMTRPPV